MRLLRPHRGILDTRVSLFLYFIINFFNYPSRKEENMMTKWELVKEQLPTLTKMAREGNTEKEMIDYLKISRPTFYKFKKEHKEMEEALAEGYRTSLEKVEAALYKAALGYTYEEITQERDRNGNMIETKRVKKEVQPNVSAIMNILKNKKGSEWITSEKIDVSGKIATTTELPELPSEKVSELAKLLLEEDDTDDE